MTMTLEQLAEWESHFLQDAIDMEDGLGGNRDRWAEHFRIAASIAAAHLSQPQPVAQGDAVDKPMIDSLKSASGYQLRDGTGAMDALFSLAVEAGADRTAAAGFAHHVNGALSELQGLVYSMAGIASSKATIPTGHRVVPVDLVSTVSDDNIFFKSVTYYPYAEHTEATRFRREGFKEGYKAALKDLSK